MPRMGMPRPKSSGEHSGAPSAYTDDGPPDKMMAMGWRRRMSSSGIEYGWISEYTASSRTRRAMSWVNCEPKSRMRTSWPNAAVNLVAPALVGDDLAGRRVGAGEERADHDGVGAGGEGLDEVARLLDAAVGDDGDVVLLRRLGAVGDGGDLGDAHAGD